MKSIHLEKVSKVNWKKACMIEIKTEQQNFLAPVGYCLARAFINPYEEPIEPYVICLGKEIVGFFWITFVEKGATCILCGFRIDKNYQGLGYSKAALNEIILMLKRERTESISIQLFVESSNGIAKKLFNGFNFQTVMINNESGLELMVYTLKPYVEIKVINEDCLNDE